MAERWQDEAWAKDMWWSGKTTRRKFLGLGAVAPSKKGGGSNGRPIELRIGDYESKPDVGRRKAERFLVEDKIDAHVGGYLSNCCLACMPLYERHTRVNMITT